MAHLTDMEELLGSIESSLIRDYMREAMNCYMNSAYRGCIVLSYIALFDDILSKLRELGNVNKEAKRIFEEASKRKDNQDVYESFLIDQLTASNLFTTLDATFLKTLTNLRNKSAHPSGHQPSPEEARFIFFEVVSRFLSSPILSTTQLVDGIISRIGNSVFFPSTYISDVTTIVKEELVLLHAGAIPQLVEKIKSAVISTDKEVSQNASYFLTGLAALDTVEINKQIYLKVFKEKSDDPQYSQMILRLLSSNGKLISELNPADLSRVKKIISNKIDILAKSLPETKFSHPTYVFNSLAKHLDDSEMILKFKNELTALFEKRPYSTALLRMFNEHPELFNLYFSCIVKKAGSTSFEVANEFAHAVEKMDEELSKLLSGEQAFLIIVAIIKAASHGAFNSAGIRTAYFQATPFIRAKAIEYALRNKAAANKLLKGKISTTGGVAGFTKEYLEA